MVIANEPISLRVSIVKGDINGDISYSEIHDVISNNIGLINLEVGRGSLVQGAFDMIPWGEDIFFVRLEIDLEGGSNYQLLGTSQLLSVPYALYSESSGDDKFWISHEESIYFNEGNVGIGTVIPESSAILDLSSSDKGFLPPRLTQAQILEISEPANGLIVFCITDNKFYAYLENDSTWREILYGPGTLTPPGSCDSNITVNHLAGPIAPVTKTVTYNIVTNVPGENSKCWISSNLGADHKAISIDDTTEASAGWYWQFNQQQGYKHNGITRTPQTTWINAYDQDSDWQAINDPCTIELGYGWRIPTKTEWENVDGAGGWIDWTGPWNSLLRLHAGGFLNYPDSDLRNRGISGSHWSSNQVNVTNGWHLDFRSIHSGLFNNTKAFGISIRCLKD